MFSKLKIKDYIVMALMLCFIIICSKLQVPTPFGVSYTLQTLGIGFLALYLKPVKSTIVLLIYIVIGLLGIPVFSTGGGFSYLLSPSFGFIIGFIPFAIIIGINKKENLLITSIYFLISLIVLYIFGAVYMYFILNYHKNVDTSFIYILTAYIVPFILKDVVSLYLAYFINNRINHFKNNKSTSN